MMRLLRSEVARAAELLPRALMLGSRHGVDFPSTVNPNLPNDTTAKVEAVLHELAHFIVMEKRPGRRMHQRINDAMIGLSPHVRDELEIDTAYVTLWAGVDLEVWTFERARSTFIYSTSKALAVAYRREARVADGFKARASERSTHLADARMRLVDWFLNEESNLRAKLRGGPRAANNPKELLP